jgi:hypothetical protein
MLESEKLAIAAHLHVVMRRKIGRVTDVEWLLRSPEYAREIIRIAQSEPQHPEMIEWASRLQDALFAPSADSKKAAAAMADAQDSTHQASGFMDSRLGLSKAVPKPPAPRYVGSLR